MNKLLSVILYLLVAMSLVIAPVVAQQGIDEIEPNDSPELADIIDGFTIDGEVGNRDDMVDWYVLIGQEGYNPTLTLTYDDYECDIDMDIYSDDEVIASADGIGSPETLTCYVPGTCFLKVMAFEGKGWYTIELEADMCAGTDEIESNDERSLADFVDDLTIEGYACTHDHDWFILDGDEGTRPAITLFYDSNFCDIDLEVWSGDQYAGELLAFESPDTNIFTVPGNCIIHVWSHEGEGEYVIEIEP